ncbi:methylated-DNA--[protein]-cysteine S-methyltransferase [Desulfopila aestuarii]|uniref:methylated-DNA--[protein]-cysteine S-methyltransferase n=1 Tax=Desulfopila aestuarii DSM 18488 TaxID=1121416 RepID=A0A1M7Y895_9BACT|nr:methylated-DNA--[protein]-cysteine S-methyltransferase [Desulfopila aestuarii]SHO48864.1 methylated-DNA-[protein]-cysteine S-methyltransferase [Desulfopila aestuarii DSM 18488]
MDYFFEIKDTGQCPLRGFIVSADLYHVQGVRFVLKDENNSASTPPGPLHRRVQEQIEAYLQGQLQQFDLPVKVAGTPFQQRAWAIMAEIPFGETLTYGEIGVRLGGAHLARAVGNAANKNPLPLIIPCHRVLGKNGNLTGFACGTETKAFLLALERESLGG